MRGWIVTGTDTGIGKTVLAAALCAVRDAAGHEVSYLKPIQSGAADGDDDAADVGALAHVPTTTLFTLGPSLAPAVALRLGGAELTLDEVIHGVRTAVTTDEVVLEGAGGLLVELTTDGATVADLAAALDLPLLVAVRPGLGTLNHTALTLEAAARRSLTVAGIVVVGYPTDPDEATRTNGAELDRLADGRLLGVIPHLGDRLDLDAASDWLAPRLGGTFDRRAWLASSRSGPEAHGTHDAGPTEPRT